ncbi:hypothetical protein BofuT4_P033000.1 [Botrytis cinerea T4]|uniref:Uncharacterized protein n=2 Tax=Botryotinia fuckeliana TaxID=40559 RepID=G2Y7T0_BOTF4|nr:hypothetical protein BofuT4_P033000.1 [Botrytis cinerea T4]
MLSFDSILNFCRAIRNRSPSETEKSTMENHSGKVQPAANAKSTKIDIRPFIQPRRRYVTCFTFYNDEPIGDPKRTTLRGNNALESCMQEMLAPLNDKRVNANGFKKVQGISRDVTIVDMTLCGKLTAFADDSRDLLINCTRHKYMVIFLTSTEAANPSSYGNESSYLRMKGAGKNWCSISEFAKANGVFCKYSQRT